MENTILFENLDISKDLKRALADMDFVEATPVQSQSIPAVLSGKDVVAQAPTGTGKTCSFGIPVIESTDLSSRTVGSLILCPTRELVVQTANELLRLTKYKKSIRIVAIYGGQSIDRQILALKKKPQIIVATPGRLMDHMRRHTVKLQELKHMILDEADEMLAMGFREDIDEILKTVPENRQTVLFSATMSKEILDITKKYLTDPVKVQITKSEITVSSIDQYYLEVSNERKTDALARLIDVNDFKLSMVFCNTKRKVDELAHEMTARGYSAEGLHGDMRQSQRDRVMQAFKNGKVEILIATDVAARGIDIKDVDAVFNYDIPDDLEYYVHRIGRTGRANRLGVSYSLVSRREMYKLHEIMRYTKAKIKFTTIPNAMQITNVRIKQTMSEILDIISHNDLKIFEESIQEYIDEQADEFTILDVAAAFLLREVGEDALVDIESGFKNTGGSNRRNNTFNPNATRLFVNIGRLDRISKGQIQKMLNNCNVENKKIFDIDIMDKFSFVEIDKNLVDNVLEGFNGSFVNGRRVNAEISTPKKTPKKDNYKKKNR